MRRNGFTLVEVIVVAVIVAIIATTATMLYTTYITEARQTTVENMAKTAAASANAYYRKTNEIPDDVYTDLKFHNPDKEKYEITVVSEGTVYSIKVFEKPDGPEHTVRFTPED